MNVKYCLIFELKLYKFELGHNIVKVTPKHLLCERWRRSWSQYSNQMIQ